MRHAPAATFPEFSLQRLTELPGPELQPDISPDGRQVVFASAASGNYDVYLLRVGGARPINLTQNSPTGDVQATFSPDGERIAFRSERDGGGLFIMGATGESVRRLTTGGYDPAWSPDGKVSRLLHRGSSGPVRPEHPGGAVDGRGLDWQEPQTSRRRCGPAGLVARRRADRVLGEHGRAAGSLDGGCERWRTCRGDEGCRNRLVTRVVTRRRVAVLLQRSRRDGEPLAGRDRPADWIAERCSAGDHQQLDRHRLRQVCGRWAATRGHGVQPELRVVAGALRSVGRRQGRADSRRCEARRLAGAPPLRQATGLPAPAAAPRRISC